MEVKWLLQGFKKFTEKAVSIMPMISTIGICLIIGSVVSHNSEKIFGNGELIISFTFLYSFGVHKARMVGLNYQNGDSIH